MGTWRHELSGENMPLNDGCEPVGEWEADLTGVLFDVFCQLLICLTQHRLGLFDVLRQL